MTRTVLYCITISDYQEEQHVNFANRPESKSKSVKNSGTQKHNTTIVIQLFLSMCLDPDADIMDIFGYENQKEPLSLADRGMMKSGAK